MIVHIFHLIDSICKYFSVSLARILVLISWTNTIVSVETLLFYLLLNLYSSSVGRTKRCLLSSLDNDLRAQVIRMINVSRPIDN